MKEELIWCKKNVKERWKNLVIAQKIYEDGKKLPEKYEKIKLPFVEEEVNSKPFFNILKKFLKISFGENGSMASVIKDNQDILAIYFEPVKNCVIQDFKEYYPKTKKEGIELLEKLNPEFIKILDVKFADLLHKNLKNKNTEERFLATFLTILYSLKKGYLIIKPVKNIFKLLYLFANLIEIKDFNIPNIKLPLSYELCSNKEEVKIKKNLITLSIDMDKAVDLLNKINNCKDTKEILKTGSKEGIRFLKSNGLKIKNAFGFWSLVKNYIKDMDEDIFERFEGFLPQAEKIVMVINSVLLFIEFDCGEIKKITIDKEKGTNEEMLNYFWDNYGYIDVFVELKKNKLDIIIPKFKIPTSPIFLLKLLKAIPDIIKK